MRNRRGDESIGYRHRIVAVAFHERPRLSDPTSIDMDADGLPVFAYPWPRGKSFVVASGFHDSKAHRGVYAYAVDFLMSPGSQVCAARQGTVVAVESRYSRGGNDPALRDKANFVLIRHSDGSTSRYMHLRKGGVTVRAGQRVKAGDLIGHSGSVGWSTGPHLHFDVVVPDERHFQATTPFRFRRPDGSTFQPESGMRLEH